MKDAFLVGNEIIEQSLAEANAFEQSHGFL